MDTSWQFFIDTIERQANPIDTLICERTNFCDFRTLLRNRFHRFSTIYNKFTQFSIEWQIPTLITCYRHQDAVHQILQYITSQGFSRCPICNDKGHDKPLCSQTKIACQNRRLKQASNPRKDTQCEPYANISPFHLLTQMLIPDEVFLFNSQVKRW